MKYADALMEWLAQMGHTHCFTVAGGNSMHLLDGARRTMTVVPVVHEVAAGIAAEYFNATASAEGRRDRAFVLVTAGPGLTNLITAMAGAFLESRELLVVGGQVKSTDLASRGLRQRGIQEVDGVALAAPVCVATARIEEPLPRAGVEALVRRGSTARKGPVFLEVCLDAQGQQVEPEAAPARTVREPPRADPTDLDSLGDLLRGALRPVLLLGGGVSRAAVEAALPALVSAGLPVMTTWNGADRIGADCELFVGRPNTWGQRSANVLIQQSDLVIALGSRLGLQQTGFNWQGFAPLARVVQVDVDATELTKGHPTTHLALHAEADAVLAHLSSLDLPSYAGWLAFARSVREELPLVEAVNQTAPGYVDPFAFVTALSKACTPDDLIIPCSSGGAFTVTMQAFEQKSGQVIITDKGLASMGYGLAGAIGAAVAAPGRRTVLLEGDGGFSQNLQELATVSVHSLPVKVLLFSNEGYASIRMTQRNYFNGEYVGCDVTSGLGFPQWEMLFAAYGIPCTVVATTDLTTDAFQFSFAAPGPAAFIVRIDPEQTYFPKITSRMTATGGMESQPLHLMSPDLPADVARRVLPHLPPAEDA